MNIAKMKPFDKIEIIRKTQGLSITQKLILLVIASHLGQNEFCYLSLTSLQKECCIQKRSCLDENLDSLVAANILWRISPSHGFKSNRYRVNFELILDKNYSLEKPKLPKRKKKGEKKDNSLVTDGHYSSDLRSLDQSPTVTSLVTDGHPKRKLNKVKENERDNLCTISNLEEQKLKAETKELAEQAREEMKALRKKLPGG